LRIALCFSQRREQPGPKDCDGKGGGSSPEDNFRDSRCTTSGSDHAQMSAGHLVIAGDFVVHGGKRDLKLVRSASPNCITETSYFLSKVVE
jgi:hypothetical protein